MMSPTVDCHIQLYQLDVECSAGKLVLLYGDSWPNRRSPRLAPLRHHGSGILSPPLYVCGDVQINAPQRFDKQALLAEASVRVIKGSIGRISERAE